MIRIDTDPRRIDWFRVLADLQRAGVPVKSVATMLRIPRSTMVGWRQGAEPKFVDGERLLQLWSGLTGRQQAEAPRVGATLSAQRAVLQG